MKIQLRQKDIEAALRAYLASQGIAVGGKDFTVAFTVKRKQGGIIADVTIEDSGEIPGFTDSEPEAGVSNPPSELAQPAPTIESEPADPQLAVEVMEAPESEVAAPKPKTSSLFGS